MEDLKFITTSGPYGDQCSSFDVVSSIKNIKEFIYSILKNRPTEWGYFTINAPTNEVHIEDKYGNLTKLKPIRIEYKQGKLLNELPETLINSEIKYPVKANGGWSSMDYSIWTTDFKYKH